MIYSCGMIAYDVVFSVKEFPKPSSSSYIEKMEEHFGGAAGNVAYACARYGEPTSVISLAGAEFPGSAYESRLRESGVGMEHLKIVEGEKTAKAFMFNDRKKRMISFFHWGAAKKFSEHKPPRLNLGKGDVLHIASGHPGFNAKLIENCSAAEGAIISFDPGYDIIAYNKKTIRRILSKSTVVFGNEFEMARMREIIGDPRDLGIEVVVETLGPRGATISAGRGRIHIRAAKARVVDTIGAGDAYRAAFLCATVRGYDVPERGKIAAKASAFAIEQVGAQTNVPAWRDLLSR